MVTQSLILPTYIDTNLVLLRPQEFQEWILLAKADETLVEEHCQEVSPLYHYCAQVYTIIV